MPIDSRSALAFGPSFVFSGMLSRVANRLSHTFFVICMTSRLFDTPRMFQYGKSQKTDLVFHTFSSGSGAFCLELIFPGGGHFFQFFNIMSISVPLLLPGPFGVRLFHRTDPCVFSMGHCEEAIFDVP